MAAAALLFIAACAWTGAFLYGALGRLPAALPAAAEERCVLRGIAIRRETRLAPVPGAQDGRRLRCEGGPGVYFADCDGYEALTPETAEALGPGALSALLDAPPGERTGARLVEDAAWYYAALLPAGAQIPEPGPCRLRFEGFADSVPARLLRVREENGETLLLFRLTEGGDYLRIRKIEAETERS